MFLLFETIRIEDGVPKHLPFHQARIGRTWLEAEYPGTPPDLGAAITVPEEFSTGLVQCTVEYTLEITEIRFRHYRRKEIRTLRAVEDNEVNYRFKYRDRSKLDGLYSENKTYDDIIIVKGGMVTDSSMANLIFYTGTEWHTPLTPLLKGTTRERLLQEGSLLEVSIRKTDILGYQGCKLINAMRYPEEQELIPAGNIFF
jgi:4-amino-4-deoxychorismate lyase